MVDGMAEYALRRALAVTEMTVRDGLFVVKAGKPLSDEGVDTCAARVQKVIELAVELRADLRELQAANPQRGLPPVIRDEGPTSA